MKNFASIVFGGNLVVWALAVSLSVGQGDAPTPDWVFMLIMIVASISLCFSHFVKSVQK